MKTKYGIAMLALAVACISVVPALAAGAADSSKTNGPADFCQKGGFGFDGFGGFDEFGDWMLLVDNATRENFENMTLAELKDLKEQKTQELENMTLAQIKELRAQKAQEAQEKFENMTLGEIKALRNETCPVGQDGNGPMGRDGMDQGRMLKVRMGQGMDGNSDGFGSAFPDGQNMQAGREMGGR